MSFLRKSSFLTTFIYVEQFIIKVKVKLSLQQDVKAYKTVRRRGSHILSRQSIMQSKTNFYISLWISYEVYYCFGIYSLKSMTDE
jgi:hypothetical protein